MKELGAEIRGQRSTCSAVKTEPGGGGSSFISCADRQTHRRTQTADIHGSSRVPSTFNFGNLLKALSGKSPPIPTLECKDLPKSKIRSRYGRGIPHDSVRVLYGYPRIIHRAELVLVEESPKMKFLW
ncbi:hypothetical protein J6590_007006 [Homalodisca vitripennis]|nr:hypothetical protein J6590_007006 [Homalodisca vitripennis]